MALALTACSHGSGDSDEEPLTLSAALGIAELPSVTDADRLRKAEELVADCMAEQGWEYAPSVYVPPAAVPATTEADELERIEREGYGFAYQYLNAGVASGDDAPQVDPNESYLASLTEQERKAWEDALYGTEEEQAASETTVTSFDPASGAQLSITGRPAGCYKLEFDMMYSQLNQTQGQADLLREYWDAVQEEIKADPRTVALDEKWVECMTDAGYPATSRDAFNSSTTMRFMTSADEIVGKDATADPTAGWTQDEIDEFFATATQEQIDARYASSTPELTADQRARLEAQLAEEVEVALAEHACTAANRAPAATIAAEVEQRYVENHQDEIAALALSLRGED